jgi:hypothetical protein|tara:strand:+ start:67 stop:411 length:345 start_codon:yes stop_codon:yes gene_type:complete
MSAGSYDITCEQGTTFSRTFTVKDSSGTARNLSSYTAKMQVRRTQSSSSTIIELTTENGRISLNSSGQVALSISAADTAGLSDDGIYDLELISSGGVVERLVEGNFTLDLEVTR